MGALHNVKDPLAEIRFRGSLKLTPCACPPLRPNLPPATSQKSERIALVPPELRAFPGSSSVCAPRQKVVLPAFPAHPADRVRLMLQGFRRLGHLQRVWTQHRWSVSPYLVPC